MRFEIDREALTLDYSIVPEDEDHAPHTTEQGLDELHAIREYRRLTRSIECVLPVSVGWDIQISTKASSEQVAQLPWTTHVTRSASGSPGSSPTSSDGDQVVFGVKHSSLPNDHSVLKVRIIIELSGPNGIRLNGIPHPVEQVEERDPLSHYISQQMLQDASSTADMSFNTQSSLGTIAESASRSSTLLERPVLTRQQTERTAAAEKSILSRVKRNYIYFSSLLQEPEAKWRRSECSIAVVLVIASSFATSHRGAGRFHSATRLHRPNAGRVSCGSDLCWAGVVGPVRRHCDTWRTGVLGSTVRRQYIA